MCRYHFEGGNGGKNLFSRSGAAANGTPYDNVRLSQSYLGMWADQKLVVVVKDIAPELSEARLYYTVAKLLATTKFRAKRFVKISDPVETLTDNHTREDTHCESSY